MNIRPSLEEVRAVAETGTCKVLPVSCELLSDLCTPIQALKKLKNVSTHCYILESVDGREKWGRYTFLGYDPKLEITCLDGEMKVGSLTFHTNDPSTYLRQILRDHKSPRFDYLPSFTGGLVGYFSYDYLTYREPTAKRKTEDAERFKDVDLMLFDKVIAFDNFRQKIVLIVNMDLEHPETGYNKAVRELEDMADLLKNGRQKHEPGGQLLGEVTPLFDQAAYCAMVEKAKNYIREGDIFQIVLSNRLSLYTFPLAGTRPRGRTEEEDKALEADLLSDEKELAEHNMLVDLGRNDLGKISRFGSVQVEKLHSIERYSHVMHIGSTVRGEIRDDCDALDAVEAVLPAGTLSGAPKIRACQLIGELENNKRGIYGGAIGYLDFTGNMDTCIAIRIAYKKSGRVFIRSGAGIVADSVPEKEYVECINKARAVVHALEQAGEVEP